MRGFPNHLKTKEDYTNMLAIDPEQAKARLQALMDDRFTWKQTDVLSEGDLGQEDETHKIIESSERDEETGEETTVRYQYELQEDFNSHFFLLGFTVDEVENIITNTNN